MEDFEKFFKGRLPFHTSELNYYKKYINRTMYQNPTIIEERQMNVAQMDVFSRLMMDRIIVLGDKIAPETANIVKMQLLFLDSINNNDIKIYIDSPGGEVHTGMGIISTMRVVKSQVATTCIGMAASMGAMILMCGARGKRESLEYCRVMIHQPLGGVQGQATEIIREAEEIKKIREELYQIISQRTGKDLETVSKDCERDTWLTPKEAKDYGIIDNVVPIVWD